MERKIPGRDMATAFNLLLSYFAVGDVERMRRALKLMLVQRCHVDPEDDRNLNLKVCVCVRERE